MRGRRVLVWHPDSPGGSVVVWRSWWKRKFKIFASEREMRDYYRWHSVLPSTDVRSL